MGHQHVDVGDKVTYTYCAPASGNHYQQAGHAGPIPARVYGPSDNVIPQGWIHNLEHGGARRPLPGRQRRRDARGPGAAPRVLRRLPASPVCDIPKGVIGPVIARFDQMSSPFQAIVWGRVLPLDTFDQAKILAFWNQWGEQDEPGAALRRPEREPEPERQRGAGERVQRRGDAPRQPASDPSAAPDRPRRAAASAAPSS